MRVVPNLYPAFEHQEVVIHSPDHVRSFAELDDEQVKQVGEAWGLRAEEALVAEGKAYVAAFINEGRLAGASLSHSHSQIVWLDSQPPAVMSEDQQGIPKLLDRDELVINEMGELGLVAIAHPAGAPYEALIAAREPFPEAVDNSDYTKAFLLMVRDLVRRLHQVEGHYPWNAWFHSGDHAHAHFVPRLTALASLELGAGLYVNVVPPELAAEKLRAVDV